MFPLPTACYGVGNLSWQRRKRSRRRKQTLCGKGGEACVPVNGRRHSCSTCKQVRLVELGSDASLHYLHASLTLLSVAAVGQSEPPLQTLTYIFFFFSTHHPFFCQGHWTTGMLGKMLIVESLSHPHSLPPPRCSLRAGGCKSTPYGLNHNITVLYSIIDAKTWKRS